MGQFGAGQGLRRVEDERFLAGQGRYTDDITLPTQAYGAVVRSPHAHAEIAGIDTIGAAAAPGVSGVFTADDLAADGVGDIPCLVPIKGKNASGTIMPPHPVLARGRVRYVGDPVVFVVAETMQQARDAAELVVVDYEPLPAVIGTDTARSPDAPQIWDEARGNLCLDWELGDRASVDAAFARAHHVTRLELINNRIVANPMEPRVALGDFDAQAERLTLYTPTQGSHRLKGQLAERIFKLPIDRIRIVTPDVGGGFGMKIFLYSEQVLVMWAARRLGRPVKWTGERGEGFISDCQGRDHVTIAELALDRDGHFLGLRARTVANMGAYLSNFAPLIPTEASGPMFSGLYAISAVHVEVACVFTNTVPVDAYRGAGRPEAAYVVERLVEAAARDIGLGVDEIRRRNFIPPEAMPYATVTGVTYDSGNFRRIMEQAMEHIDWAGLPARKEMTFQAGRLRGAGMSCYVECCAGVGAEEARLRLDADGGVTLLIGTQSNGQGHATAYAQLLHDRLGLPPELIRVHQGDSDVLGSGGGTGGSRSLLMGSGALHAAAESFVSKARKAAGHLLEAAEPDLEYQDAAFSVVGTDRRLTLQEVARAIHGGDDLPDELAGGIDEAGNFAAPPMTYPNGCHIAEVEVDPGTGVVRVVRYVVVDDFGTVINPLLVAGQVHGGTVQGIGQALLERTVFDPESGQLLTGSFMDYCLPRADDLPDIELTLSGVPCATNPWGIKGAGEAGAIGAPPALINAVIDALAPLGVRHIDMPATPERVWRAIRSAERKEAG